MTLYPMYVFRHSPSRHEKLNVSQRSVFDIAVKNPDPCTTNIIVETFLNQPWVRDALGVPLNFTSGLALLPANFLFGTGDPFRRDIKDLESVLSSGVKVSLIYGDRDYRCNCSS
jgi:Serine carboxypeptidase